MFKSSGATHAGRFEDFSLNKNTSSSQVAIYNDDDLSHLLYIESVDHGSNFMIINKVEHVEPETPPESPLVSDAQSHCSDDESAVLSDCDEDYDLEIPPSPSRRRGGTMSMSDDDFEFPVFLGRQQEVEQYQREEEEEVQQQQRQEAPKTLYRLALRQPGPASKLGHKGQSAGARTSTQVKPGEPLLHHVDTIEGPLMSWWPASMEGLEYEWEQRSSRPETAQHVSGIDGPLMSWWPSSPEVVQYDWNERFFE